MNTSQQTAIAVAIDLQRYVSWLQHHMVDMATPQNNHESAQQVEANVTFERWMSRRQLTRKGGE